MWLSKQRLNSIVALSFKPQGIGAAYIQETGSQVSYSMKNFMYFPCNDMELERQIIFNPTRIGNYLRTLMGKMPVSHTEVRMSLEGPSIFEQLVDKESFEDKIFSNSLNTMVWDSVLLGNQGAAQDMHYVCGITRELLFQYKLLALRYKLNVSCITTRTIALLQFAEKVSFVPTMISDLVNLAIEFPIGGICLNVPTEVDKVLIAELLGLCMARLSYD
jgi:hypothetical protein